MEEANKASIGKALAPFRDRSPQRIARADARARANEARYLANFIELGADLYPEEDA